MSLYILDTDILTDLEFGKANVVREYQAHRTSVGITEVNIQEKLRGWYDKLGPKNTIETQSRYYGKLGNAARFLSTFKVLHVTEAALRKAVILENPGTILVTHNQRHYVHTLPVDRRVDWPK